MQRRRMVGKVFRRADHGTLYVAQARRGQVLVMQNGHPDRKIQTLLGQRLAMIGKQKIERHARMTLEKSCQRRGHVIAAKRDRRRNPQLSSRRSGMILNGSIGGAQLSKNPLATLIATPAAVGLAQATGRSCNQPTPKLPLAPRQGTAYRRQRQSQGSCSG